MERLKTPFGEIDILVDNVSMPYVAQKGSIDDVLFPDIQGRYQIEVHYTPDGKEHTISCVFSSSESYNRGPESGEDLECQGFYNNQRIKMSIGLECEAGYIGGQRVSEDYDYDADYLENGMAYVIMPDTKTEKYTFGIAWIDNVGWDEQIDDKHNRDVQTWFAADPTLSL